jgi:hypothetical protein
MVKSGNLGLTEMATCGVTRGSHDEHAPIAGEIITRSDDGYIHAGHVHLCESVA